MASALSPVSIGWMERFGNIEVSPEVIADFCWRHHIRKLAFFGSVLRKDFTPDSDVDVLVEFDPAHIPGFRFVRIQDELSAVLQGRKVDLATFKGLNPRLRDRVLSGAWTAYEQG